MRAPWKHTLLLALFLAVFFVFPCRSLLAAPQAYAFYIGLPVNVCLENGYSYDYGAASFVYNGAAYVPARFFIDVSGAEIERVDGSRVAVRLADGRRLEVAYSPPSVALDGQSLELPGPPLERDGRLMLPARLVGQVFGYGVQWVEADGDTPAVVVFYPQSGSEGVSRAGADRYALYAKVQAAKERGSALVTLGEAYIDPPNEPKYEGNVYNSRVAAERIDGRVLQPGEVFSFNAATGPREAWSGFVWGLGFGGPDMGSGVCRTATVLYQAARNAGLEIVERHTHVGGDAPYASHDDDAAVQWGVADLKFANPYGFPVKIRVRPAGKTGLEAKIIRLVN